MSETPPTVGPLRAMLGARLEAGSSAWLEEACAEIAAGVAPERFVALLSLASRHVPRAPLAPDVDERAAAAAALADWDPERWDVLDAARVLLVLAHPGIDGPDGEQALEEAFRYADAGELVALYRALPHLPAPERFAWRAGEGARSNMRAVYEAACCDTPFPGRWFDDVAWRSAVLKALFVEAPLWRVQGLDERLDGEIARMALDFADERRSAGRPVPAELWLCLGAQLDARAEASLERELEAGSARGRAAAVLALVRAGRRERAHAAAFDEGDAGARAIMEAALEGRSSQRDFAALEELPA